MTLITGSGTRGDPPADCVRVNHPVEAAPVLEQLLVRRMRCLDRRDSRDRHGQVLWVIRTRRSQRQRVGDAVDARFAPRFRRLSVRPHEVPYQEVTPSKERCRAPVPDVEIAARRDRGPQADGGLRCLQPPSPPTSRDARPVRQSARRLGASRRVAQIVRLGHRARWPV